VLLLEYTGKHTDAGKCIDNAMCLNYGSPLSSHISSLFLEGLCRC